MTRRKLDQRRQSETIKFEHDGIKYYVTYSCFKDGVLAEIFLNAGKHGSAINTSVREAAVAVSIALQYGAPEDVLRDAMLKLETGEAAGAVGAALDVIKDRK